MKVTDAEFVKSAFQPAHYPQETMPEVAFAGKSNVGKSSLINRLVNRKKLARTSSSPGRTQAINFFFINKKFSFVDLPGYGYAKVPRDVQRRWKPMVEAYLSTRKNLRLVVVILDIRREAGNDDRALLEWLAHYNIESLVILTKIDKISKNRRAQRTAAITKDLGLQDTQLVLFSAQTGEGKGELWTKLLSALTTA
jgi:GTP-binding protein